MHGGIKQMNNFHRDLEYSFSMSDAPWWEVVYRKAFVDFLGMADIRKNGWCQASGVDRIVILESGTTLKIDEKVRRKDYGDILLEYISNDRTGSPGWVEKSLNCDFIAYAFEPSQKCYLLPFQTLRRAWQKRKDEWLKGKILRAENKGPIPYSTLSVAVPIKTLLLELAGAIQVDWGAP